MQLSSELRGNKARVGERKRGKNLKVGAKLREFHLLGRRAGSIRPRTTTMFHT